VNACKMSLRKWLLGTETWAIHAKLEVNSPYIRFEGNFTTGNEGARGGGGTTIVSRRQLCLTDKQLLA